MNVLTEFRKYATIIAGNDDLPVGLTPNRNMFADGICDTSHREIPVRFPYTQAVGFFVFGNALAR